MVHSISFRLQEQDSIQQWGDNFFTTVSCAWSTQLCQHPSGPCVREPLPFTVITRIMSGAWSNHSHSDYESLTLWDNFFMTMSCAWSTQLCHCPSGPHVRGPLPFTCIKRIMSCTWSNHSHLDYESSHPAMGDKFFMTISCAWSTQLCHCPSGPHVRGPLPFTCINIIMSCVWSNQSHSDYESRTPSSNGGTTFLQSCLALGQPNYAIVQVVLILEGHYHSLVSIE